MMHKSNISEKVPILTKLPTIGGGCGGGGGWWFLIARFFNWISCNKGLKVKLLMFFFLFKLLRMECSRIRKTASFLTSHNKLNKYKIYIHGAWQMEPKCGNCWKLQLFEGKLLVFISYLSEMKTVSMFYNSSLF